jgi:hypothetical protein
MKRLLFAVMVVPAVLFAVSARAQEPDRLMRPLGQGPVTEQVAQTEDMWFYLQELRRHDDPQVAIRKKAEKKGEQRRSRLAAMKWFGWSQSRPTASPTPWNGVYAPHWAGNGIDPSMWIGSGYVTTAVRVDSSSLAR